MSHVDTLASTKRLDKSIIKKSSKTSGLSLNPKLTSYGECTTPTSKVGTHKNRVTVPLLDSSQTFDSVFVIDR